jgi:hypothetical protein
MTTRGVSAVERVPRALRTRHVFHIDGRPISWTYFWREVVGHEDHQWTPPTTLLRDRFDLNPRFERQDPLAPNRLRCGYVACRGGVRRCGVVHALHRTPRRRRTLGFATTFE